MVGKLSKMIDHLQIAMEHIVIDIGEEVGIFEVSQHEEIDHNASDHECFASRGLGIIILHRIHSFAEKVTK